MRWKRTIQTVDVHCAGEIGRVITGGVLNIPGATMADKLHHLNSGNDDLRRWLCSEPRSGPAGSFCLLVPACDPQADVGLIILQPDQAHAMSGSNAMCATTALLETGMIPMVEPVSVVTFDTAAGLVKATASCQGGKVVKVTLDMPPAERVRALARAKGCAAEDITVCILERPRHEAMIEEVRSTGAAIRLITDGDVAGVIHCAEAEITGIDMYMGSGGAPEGVLAASALKCMGGQIYGRLLFRNEDEKARARKAGITDLNRVYTRDEMVTADVIFAATGVTSGSILSGIKREPGWMTTETLLMRSKTGSVRRMTYRSPVK